ncbi:MAG: DUF3857 and transglutaminase domain-containing protein [Bacteroidales bacterium]|nr:DUF3857 and transglutaminase domain-containing protein [Bacteroidales bacterium]MCF8402303.1 DUF3857 and transglutaminase domain-containing protein [Bacteroidales bacterium]
MKKTGLLLFTLLSICLYLQAQRNHHRLYNFKEDAVITELLPHEEGESAVILKDVRIFEYKMEMTGFNTYSYLVYQTIYKNIRINDDKAMDDLNKVAIPMNGVRRIVQMSARAISPAGLVTRLDSSNIKEIKNLQGYGNFKVFAIEGAEVGGEIEYKYTVVKTSNLSHVEIFQGEYPIREGRFEIIAPHKFRLEAKGYNGFPELELDEKGRKAWTANLNFVPGLPEEEYSTWTANRMKVAYTIVSVTSMIKNDWRSIAKGLYGTINKFKAGELKKAAKALAALGIENMSEDEKIRAIENYIKTTYSFKRNASSLIKDIFKTKQGDELGMARLFVLFYREAGIDFEIVITSDRYQSRFDDDFPVTTDFDGLLLYFPSQKKYLYPGDFAYRYSLIPYKYTDNKALNILNEYNYSFREVAHSDTSDNVLLKNTRVRLDENGLKANLEVEQILSGNRAVNARKVFEYAEEKEKQEYIEFISASGLDDFEIVDYQVENEKFEASVNNQPFKFTGNLTSGSLTEKAGKDIILNIGRTIGRQSELYQEEERKQPFDMRHPVVYHYKIGFEIPTGFGITGLDDFKTDHVMKDGEQIIARFKSDYKVSPGLVEISIHEYYVNTIYPKESYDEIRKIINAAADFYSKSVLLIKEED